MGKRNLNKILPVLCFSLCWVYSCSQSAVEQPSSYSKTEEAAYKEALIAARELSRTLVTEEIAVGAYDAIQEEARAAQAELEQAEAAYKKAEQTAKQAKASLSSLERNIEKEIHNDSAYKSAQSALSEASRYGSKSSDKRYSLGLKVQQIERDIRSKSRKALDQSENNVAVAYKSFRETGDKLRSAKENAYKINQALQYQATQVKAARRHADEARRDVYMAAALGAFKHVAEEAIAKTQAEIVAQD